MNADLDHIAFAPGDSNKVMLSGRGLPYRHGIADVHPLPGETFQIMIRKDDHAENEDRSFFSRVIGLLFPTNEIAS